MKLGSTRRQRIAIAGTGISGLSAAMLLHPLHDIVVYEAADRLGGHANTVIAPSQDGPVAVDMGFIVYNESTYPNLAALFDYLDVETTATDMSFAASRHNGTMEYNGESLNSLFAQRSNILRPRFWAMLADLVRFYKSAPADLIELDRSCLSLGDYLKQKRYCEAFVQDHLLPLAAAIWSSPANRILDYPAASFIRFQENHGLLKLTGRPLWRTVTGGSSNYVKKLSEPFKDRIRLGSGVASVVRSSEGVRVEDTHGRVESFDQIIFATQADQALHALKDADTEEREVLSRFKYSQNEAWLHTDESWMPRRKSIWGSWNYIEHEQGSEDSLTVTYWMNRLQPLPSAQQFFVTLNPTGQPEASRVIKRETYRHPIFDAAAIEGQRRLWSLQGQRGTWFCGSYFGAGFHEDGLQSGLAVAELAGGVRRPWRVENESARIGLPVDFVVNTELRVAA